MGVLALSYCLGAQRMHLLFGIPVSHELVLAYRNIPSKETLDMFAIADECEKNEKETHHLRFFCPFHWR
jgi:hypothetical protein